MAFEERCCFVRAAKRLLLLSALEAVWKSLTLTHGTRGGGINDRTLFEERCAEGTSAQQARRLEMLTAVGCLEGCAAACEVGDVQKRVWCGDLQNECPKRERDRQRRQRMGRREIRLQRAMSRAKKQAAAIDKRSTRLSLPCFRKALEYNSKQTPAVREMGVQRLCLKSGVLKASARTTCKGTIAGW